MVHIKRSSNGEWLVVAIVALMLLLIVSSAAHAGSTILDITESTSLTETPAVQVLAR